MTIKRARPEGEIKQWQRGTSETINQILNRAALKADAVMKDGVTIYAGDTAGVGYDQTKMQALMDAVQAISDRLE